MMEEKNNLPVQFLIKEAKNNIMHYHLKRVKEANLPKKVEDLAVVLLKSYKNGYGHFDYDIEEQKLEDLKPLCEGISWRDKDFLSLFEVLYGKEYAPFVVEALESMGEIAYQKGYTRRSFRAPSQKEIVLENQLDLLVNLCYLWQDEGKYYVLPPCEVLKYGNKTTNPAYVLPLAKKIDSGDKEIFELLENIAFAREGFEGKVSYFFVKVLLASKKRECWELVAKLLISAQRQEGLRQVIMESVDERSCPEALHFMIDLVLKEKLTRFSSVVRAVDVWFGLGFEAEKETTIKKILSLASDFLSDEKKAHQTLQNFNEKSDNIALYTAFWAISLKDVSLAMPYLETMVEKGNIQKQCLAIYIANELRLWTFQQKIYQKAFENPSMETLSMMMTSFNWVLKSNESREIRNDELFERVFSLANTFTKKEVSFEGLVFSWTMSKFERSDLYRCAFYLCGDNETNLDRIIHHFNEYDGNLREEIVREMFGEWYCYGFSALNRDNVSYGNRKKVQLTPKYRQLAFSWLTDRMESIQATSFNVIGQKELSEEELFSLVKLFARKGQGFRKQLSLLVLKQKETLIKPFIEELLQAKSSDERMGGLDLLNALYQDKKFPDFVQQKASEYSQRKLSKAEETLLSRIAPEKGSVAEILSSENGYGVFNPQNITPWELPKIIDENGFYAQRTGFSPKKSLLSSIKNTFLSENYEGRNYGFSKDWSLIKKDLENLVALFKKHKDYEYEVERWDKSKEMVLLGNEFQSKIYRDESLTPRERFESYPLWEVWEEWFKETQMDACDLFLLTAFEDDNRKKYRDFLEKYIFYRKGKVPQMGQYDWQDPIYKCLSALSEIYPFEERNDFLIDLTCNIYQNLPKEIIEIDTKNEETTYWSRDERGYGWQNQYYFTESLSSVGIEKATDIQFKKLWNIYRFVQYTGKEKNIPLNKPILEVAAPCYQMGYITKDELVDCILTEENIRDASNPKPYDKHYRNYLFKRYPFIQEIVKEIQEAFLPVEVVRGDLNTPVTKFVINFLGIEGAKYAIAMLTGLGKKSFMKGYFWYSSSEEITKQKLFSLLIKRCQPSKDDTQEVFNELIKAQGKELSQERLIEMAMYAPQWHRFVSEYLGWKGLDSGIWWMHAHTKTSDYEARSSEFESEVARYSSLDLEDFKLGAVDKPWFDKAYAELGSERWEILYNSAKYISEGNGHRRAKIYSDTLTGLYTLSDVWEKVQDKRDQEFLRVYGLVSLDKKNIKKDLLTRYENLVQFKKESRQFGSMKQTSEAIAYGVALDNLARNAGYEDPQRLVWAMEVEQVNEIFSKATSITIDNYDVSLTIDEEGKAEIEITKDGKTLKSVPASLKKNEQVLELTAYRKTLREQLSRARKGLEEAMIRGDKFSLEEIQILFTHPVIEKLLSKLLLTDNNHIGFFVDGKLKDFNGNLISVEKNAKLSLAHCYDLQVKGVWIDFQKYAFDEKLVQPFKQIFRELYVPNEDELKEVTISRRYAGHQVQPKQTLALLKSRGWKVDYEEGLQKVYHKEGFQVKLYAMADWFSPSDIEAPTLETIEFHSLKDYTNVPFKDINPLIFSEVMRDIDLVVSVAYVGGTDPEMSQSTIEMRLAILAQTLRLFKIDNVELQKSHAQIKGHFSEYSVHLGSGIVHQMGKGAMQVIPVHSQHRGRVFLPFVDDDPKTAEIISKVLLLAKDKEIKDPTILQQIK